MHAKEGSSKYILERVLLLMKEKNPRTKREEELEEGSRIPCAPPEARSIGDLEIRALLKGRSRAS